MIAKHCCETGSNLRTAHPWVTATVTECLHWRPRVCVWISQVWERTAEDDGGRKRTALTV
eukprot:309131-Rhodomonas_salina.2